MPTFHTLEEAIEEFRRKHTDLVGKLYTGEKSASHIEDFLSLVWQSAQEATKRELAEKVEKLFKDCDDREDRVEITDVLSLINK